MSDISLTRTDPFGLTLAWPALIAVCGALYFALLPFGFAHGYGHSYIGADIYDEYYRAIQQGRLDLPARLLQYEGHYTADGTGFLYHGIGPLITRLLLPIWPFAQVPLGHASIWFWAVVGTIGFQAAFLTMVRTLELAKSRRAAGLCQLLCAGLWLSSPGLMLSVNPAFYLEPIALSYAMAGLFALAYVKLVCRAWPIWLALPLLGLCAALCLHARPNVAVGLYLGTLAGITLALTRGPMRRQVAACLASLLFLGAGGVGYLELNKARFGAAGEVHGAFEASPVQYGRVFWGKEAADSPRALAFTEHGRFNAQRILPNLAIYVFYLPPSNIVPGSKAVADWMEARYRAITEPILGHIRIVRPSGMIFVWTGWVLLACLGLAVIWRHRSLAGLVLGTGVAAGVTLAYGTVTLRYSFDMWPFLITLGMIGAVTILRWIEARSNPILTTVLACALAIGSLGTLWRTANYAGVFVTPERAWSYEFCAKQAAKISLPEARIASVCRDPEDHWS